MEFPVPAYTSFTIPTGATTGARITFNENGNGQIRVYDSSGNLVDIIGGPQGAIQQLTPGNTGITIVNGQLQWADGTGNPGPGPFILSDGASKLLLESGFQGGGGSNLQGVLIIRDGDSTLTGTTNQPGWTALELMHTFPAYGIISGAIAKSSLDGTSVELPQAPTLGTGWVTASSTGNYQPITFWRDAVDNLILSGVLHATSATPATTVFTLPVGYRPPVAIRVPLASFDSAANTISGQTHLLVNASGVCQITNAAPIVVNQNYSVSTTIALRTIN